MKVLIIYIVTYIIQSILFIIALPYILRLLLPYALNYFDKKDALFWAGDDYDESFEQPIEYEVENEKTNN